MSTYSVATYSTVNEFLVNLARQRGKLKKGGVADLEAVSKIVLKDWNNGKIPYYVQPPKDERMLGASIVSKFSSEFSVDEIEQEQSEMLKVIRDTAQFGTKVVSLDNTGAQLDVQLETESTEMEDDSDDEEDDDEAPELVPMEEGSVPEFELTKKQKKSQDKPLKPQRIPVADSELNSQSNKNLKKLQKLLKKKGLPSDLLALQEQQAGSEEESEAASDFDFDVDFVDMEGSDEDDEGESGDEDEEDGEKGSDDGSDDEGAEDSDDI